jgi:hypothetical protein
MHVEHEESTGGGIILALVYGLPAFMMGLLVGFAF